MKFQVDHPPYDALNQRSLSQIDRLFLVAQAVRIRFTKPLQSGQYCSGTLYSEVGLMDVQVCTLVKVVEYLAGKKLDLTEFPERLFLQKAVYLAQLAHVNLGYRFSWYRHGPYSSDLAKTGFQYMENRQYYNELVGEYVLTQVGQARLDKIRALADHNPGMELPQWMELLASIHYLKWIAYQPNRDAVTAESVGGILREHGKEFLPDQVNAAWTELERINLIGNKLLPES